MQQQAFAGSGQADLDVLRVQRLLCPHAATEASGGMMWHVLPDL